MKKYFLIAGKNSPTKKKVFSSQNKNTKGLCSFALAQTNSQSRLVAGFSLIELLIVIVVIALLATISTVSLFGWHRTADLESATKQIVSVLRDAQSRSVAQASSTIWGVYFENSATTSPFFALFATTYSTTTIDGYYRLPARVAYATSSLNVGSSTQITFSQIRGLPSASTTIKVYLIGDPNQSSTIRIASSGAVFF